MNNDKSTVLVSGVVDTIKHVDWVAITFKMTEQVEQQIDIKSCIKVKHSSMETIQMIQKAVAMGNR